ncbi:protein ZAR1-like isoform X1 [Bos indicus]|uniref:Protein ZAR1-like isoform X1 n=1 Tax=Bos indicus TaxID=9915 RepID=A0A6P5CQ60_BOSIN
MKVEHKTRPETNCLGILGCAWAPGGRMERIFCVPYSLYPGYGNMLRLGQSGLSEPRQPHWRQTNVPPTFLARPRLLMPSNASDCCVDPYKRAQLMAVFSHMNPGLSLRLRKANTKDVGVQVSLRVGKSVQCSLGPRTLDSLSPWASAGHRAPASAWGVSSSVPGHWGEVRLREELSDPPEAGQPPPPLPPPSPPPRSEEDPPEELQPREELVEEDSSSPRERKSKPAPVDSSQPLGRPNFQFLEPKYGYFHCKDCKTRWESAYVWCISGTNKVYFKQLCCKCQKSFNPYRVEAIQCQTCSKSRCSCPQKKRHINLRRPHRQELCGRCKDKRFSCGSIYSFKYIM